MKRLFLLLAILCAAFISCNKNTVDNPQAGLDGLGAYAFCWKVLSEDADPGVGGLKRSAGLNIRPVKDPEK